MSPARLHQLVQPPPCPPTALATGRARRRGAVVLLDFFRLQLPRVHRAGAPSLPAGGAARARGWLGAALAEECHGWLRSAAAASWRCLVLLAACSFRQPRCLPAPHPIALAAPTPKPAQTPLLGHWSDLHGRRPFFLVAQACACLPLAIVLAHLTSGLSLLWYYVVQARLG